MKYFRSIFIEFLPPILFFGSLSVTVIGGFYIDYKLAKVTETVIELCEQKGAIMLKTNDGKYYCIDESVISNAEI